jgi:hypothetical protein
MPQVPSTATSCTSTDFETIFRAALDAYKDQTKKDIASHPLAAQLQSCDSSSAILAVLRAQVQTVDQSQSADEKWTKWLDPTVNVSVRILCDPREWCRGGKSRYVEPLEIYPLMRTSIGIPTSECHFYRNRRPSPSEYYL